MTGQWMSATIARCAGQRRFLLLLLVLSASACTDEPENPASVSSPESTPSEPSVLSGAAPPLLTGATIGQQFLVWICGDSSGVNLGYTFATVHPDSETTGVGHEVLLAERRSRMFRWNMMAENRLHLQFSDNDGVIEWRDIDDDRSDRLTLVHSERGPLRCLRQTVEANSVIGPSPMEVQPELSQQGTRDSSHLSAGLPGDLPGNSANGTSIGARGDLSVWVCDSVAGLFAQAYFVPESDQIQGRFMEATGINAVHPGRWMITADDVVRLDLAVQGEIMLSDVQLDERTGFSAISDRDGPLSCELESLSLAPENQS